MAGSNPWGDIYYIVRDLFRGARPSGGIHGAAGEIPPGEIDHRLHSAFGWLQQAYQAAGGLGFSMGYHHFSGWKPAYPETSGYIINSLLKYGRIFKNGAAQEMARAAGEWLCSRQNPDGGIPAIGGEPERSLVFDTGMVLHGLVDLFATFGDESAGAAARRCADFLVSTQNPDGSWSNCYHGIPHAYHARVSWPLLWYSDVFGDAKARRSAEKNLDWVVSRQRGNGYWEMAFFTPRVPHANTHSLGYILEGLVEASLIRGRPDWLASARTAADILLDKAASGGGFLPGYLDADWREVKLLPYSFACLTGIAQIARAWLLLSRIDANSRYLEGAEQAFRYISQFQNIEIQRGEIRGALPGSAPIAGGYLPFQYPNWAVKFWMDLLFDLRDLRND